MQKTPLFEKHRELKAKMVPFGGWMMPVSYAGVLAEHEAVRTACGLFDVSHMGEILVAGPEAEAYLQKITMNDIAKLKPGQGQYTAILNENGGFIDDLILYKLWDGDYLVCCNASNIEKDFSWFKTQAEAFNVRCENASGEFCQFAAQGPLSKKILSSLIPSQEKQTFDALPYTNIMRTTLAGRKVLVARTGYTGELGYEIYLPNDIASTLWDEILKAGQPDGIMPIGLGARDTLRLEACYLLYGNDMNESVSPLEAGVSWAVALGKNDFIGKDALIKQKETGLQRKIFAFKFNEEGIPRSGMKVYRRDGSEIGVVTSGSVLPTVGGAGGMALLNPQGLSEGSEVEVDVRGKRKVASLVKRPLYQAKVKS